MPPVPGRIGHLDLHLRVEQFSFILRFALTEFRDMYVCICNSVNHRQIEDAVKRGDVSSPACLRKRLGVGTGCGLCLEFAEELLMDIQLEERAPKGKSNLPAGETATQLAGQTPVSPHHIPAPGALVLLNVCK